MNILKNLIERNCVIKLRSAPARGISQHDDQSKLGAKRVFVYTECRMCTWEANIWDEIENMKRGNKKQEGVDRVHVRVSLTTAVLWSKRSLGDLGKNLFQSCASLVATSLPLVLSLSPEAASGCCNWSVVVCEASASFEYIQLPAKLLDYFLRSHGNKSNINQSMVGEVRQGRIGRVRIPKSNSAPSVHDDKLGLHMFGK